jgi:hypothetical protein
MACDERSAMLTAGLVVLGLALPGCVVRRTIELSPTSAAPRYCADGRPVKILQHPDCTGGICGYTCAPDRWTPEGK